MNVNYTSLYKQAGFLDRVREQAGKPLRNWVGSRLNKEYEGDVDYYGNVFTDDVRKTLQKTAPQLAWHQLQKKLPNQFRPQEGAMGGLREQGITQISQLMEENPTLLSNYINNMIHSRIQNQYGDYDGFDFQGIIPQSYQDRFRDKVIDYGDKHIASTLQENLADRDLPDEIKQKLSGVLNEETVNQIAHKYMETAQGRKMYPKMFNHYVSGKLNDIKKWMGEHKGLLAGAASVPLLLMLARNLMGRKQQPQPQQRRQVQPIHPYNRLY